MVNISRLSSLPLFLRGEKFWGGVLDPRKSILRDSKFVDLRNLTASHRWSINGSSNGEEELGDRQRALVDLAQSMLERGIWTPPSWRLEKYLAQCFVEHLNWKIEPEDDRSGLLGFKVEEANIDELFLQSLVTGRLESESPGDVSWESWQWSPGEDIGSREEREFFENILCPVLGFPLLDFLIPQRSLVSMGLDPDEFLDQRTDFALDTGRKLKLVIEIDGPQHQEAAQKGLDKKRDRALIDQGWIVWRIDVQELENNEKLANRLITEYLENDGKPKWGYESVEFPVEPRSKKLMTSVWGATVSYRIQFLLLEALRTGHLPWDKPWKIYIAEHDTEIADAAIADLEDWLGRLRNLRGLSLQPEIINLSDLSTDGCHLAVDISVTRPFLDPRDAVCPVAWSRPANIVASLTKSRFSSCEYFESPPDKTLVETFVRDFFRIREFREGQYEILSQIMMGRDVIGLLPTGGGKSLTYQVAGLLLGGLTIYVAPLKSLLQDQYERLVNQGIDHVRAISSALSKEDKKVAEILFSTGCLRYLLVAPERFLKQDFRDQLASVTVQHGQICQVVIDECHCVSEWGHSFRPAYLSLSRIAKERTSRLNVSAPLCALTGTASSIVLADVQRELSITEEGAIVQASSLDRSEIDLQCINVTQQQKPQEIRKIIEAFKEGESGRLDGALIFCRFIGGKEGVVGVSSELRALVPSNELKIYSGTEPDWAQFASFATRTSRRNLTKRQIQDSIPGWALNSSNQHRDWEDVKADVQRDFIGGMRRNNFQYLVATSAFGMGIDKPSIRLLIHYMAPPSPEAYYQEVGRAARDGKPAKAILLFSDEEPSLTDKILSPETDIISAKKLYKNFSEEHRFQGGDFIRTFYFHDGSFSGSEKESMFIAMALTKIRERLAQSKALVFKYHESNNPASDLFNKKENLEYALVRLINLGVVSDYTTDYSSKYFDVTLQASWLECKDDPAQLSVLLGEHLQTYMRRYQIQVVGDAQRRIQESPTINEIELAAAQGMVGYIYDQIERTRRQASRQMLELAREAVVNSEGFREKLLLYLQVSERFSRDLENLVEDEHKDSWQNLVGQVQSPDEINELHGACQRVLESYPTHTGLLAISAVTRLQPNSTEISRSQEEMRAAIKIATETVSILEGKRIGDAILDFSSGIDDDLLGSLEDTLSTWLISVGHGEEALSRFTHRKATLDIWMKSVLKEVLLDELVN